MVFTYNTGTQNVRKEKILSFIEKDIFVLNNYETVPFKNKNHAIECLIPYHIFNLTADDIKFRGSDVEIDMEKELSIMKEKIRNMIEDNPLECDGFTPQLLLYHEQRYLNSIAQQTKTESQPSKKKKQAIDRRLMKIKIPRTELYDVYGDSFKLRIKTDRKYNNSF